MDKTEIHIAIMVGGSSRIPKIQTMLSQFLDGKKISRCLDPDEAAARGVAFHAAILSGDTSSKSTLEFILPDVAPFSVGIENSEVASTLRQGDTLIRGVMSPLIKRNTSIPSKKSGFHSTIKDNQASFLVLVYEGERARTKDNQYLGKLKLSLTPAPCSVPQIKVTYRL